jgi:integrase
VHWIKRYIFFHGKRHPMEMGAAEVAQFLTFLAVEAKVAASTQNQALSALLFLYREVLGVELPWLDDVVRAKRPQYLPVVLMRDEVRPVLQRLHGVTRLMAVLLYGAGLRPLECCRLRVKDLDFTTNQIVIRDGKGRKDRVTMLPAAVKAALAAHVERMRAAPGRPPTRRRLGRAARCTGAQVPERWPRVGWQWVFPATRFYVDRTNGGGAANVLCRTCHFSGGVWYS